MIDNYKDVQDILSVAGYTQNGLQTVDHRGIETRPIQQGRCYLFDGGNDTVTIPYNGAFATGSGDYSISMWIRPTTVTGNGGVFSGFRGAGVPQIRPYIIIQVGSNLTFWSASNGNVAAWDIAVGVNFGTLTINTWAFITITREAGVHRLYLNNVQNSTFTNTTAVFTNAGSPFGLSIGEYTAPDFFQGEMHNIGFWTRALSVQEISEQFNQRIYNFANCVAFYKGDEGGGTLAVNSGLLNSLADGTINNAVLANFHSQRTDGFGADWQNQFGFTPNMRFNGGSGTSGIALDNTANSQFLQHTAFTIHCRFVLDDLVSGNMLFGNYTANGAGMFYAYVTSLGRLDLLINGTTYSTSIGDFAIGTEYHLAIVRQGTGAGQTQIYSNGVALRVAFQLTDVAINTNTVRIGQDGQNIAGVGVTGWMRNFCIVPSAIWTGVFTPPTTWADYQALELTNPSKLAIYNTNIVNNPLNVPLTLTNTINVLVPRDELNPTLDAFGEPLFYKNRVKYNADLRQSNCLTFDGVNDRVELPQITLGNGDWSIEGRFMFSSVLTTLQTIFSIKSPIQAAPITLAKEDNSGGLANQLFFISAGNGGLYTGIVPVVNQWYSYRLQKVGTVVTGFINGIEVTRQIGDNANYGTSTAHRLGVWDSNIFFFNGRQATYKITVAGTVVQDYTLQEGAGDRVFSRVGGHIGTLNNFAFPDAWANRQDVVHSNLVRGFDSVFCPNGINQQRYTYPAFTCPQEYTFDFWFFRTGNPNTGNCGIVETIDGTLNNYIQMHTTNTTGWTLQCAIGGTAAYRIDGVANDLFTDNQWVHLEVSVSSTAVRVFKNGVQIGEDTTVSQTAFTFVSALHIGGLFLGANVAFQSQGYYANWRWSNFARHTTNTTFTPPTTEADYADLTNVRFFIKGDRDIMGGTLTNINTLQVSKKPITATNPQTASNVGGTWHNNSEVLVRQPLAAELIRRNLANYFFTAGVANNLGFNALLNNISGLNQITCKTSVDQRRSNQKTYRGFN